MMYIRIVTEMITNKENDMFFSNAEHLRRKENKTFLPTIGINSEADIVPGLVLQCAKCVLVIDEVFKRREIQYNYDTNKEYVKQRRLVRYTSYHVNGTERKNFTQVSNLFNRKYLGLVEGDLATMYKLK